MERFLEALDRDLSSPLPAEFDLPSGARLEITLDLDAEVETVRVVEPGPYSLAVGEELSASNVLSGLDADVLATRVGATFGEAPRGHRLLHHQLFVKSGLPLLRDVYTAIAKMPFAVLFIEADNLLLPHMLARLEAVGGPPSPGLDLRPAGDEPYTIVRPPSVIAQWIEDVTKPSPPAARYVNALRSKARGLGIHVISVLRHHLVYAVAPVQ